PLWAAQHDEGVYRLHSLTSRQYHQRIDVQLCQVSFKVHGEVRHAHQGIRERLEVRRWPAAKALEQPGSFDLGDHRLRFRARDRAASQGHIVVDLDHHAATTEQEHRAQLRVAGHANDNFYTVCYHLLHRHADDPSLRSSATIQSTLGASRSTRERCWPCWSRA